MENKKFMWVWYAVIFIVGLLIGNYLVGDFRINGQTGAVIDASMDKPNQSINE